MLNIIIMGSQGAGKGTQAKLLAKKYNLEHIEPGSLLRDLVKKGGPLGKKINYYLNVKGSLVPTSVLISKILKPQLKRIDPHRGTIFDGSPRRLREAKALEKMLFSVGRKITHVFYIKISETETYERLGKRLNCQKCDRPLILGQDVQSRKDCCPHCGGTLYQRKDDQPQGIKNRLETFRKETWPVIKYYRKRGFLIEINGEQSRARVHQDVIKHIQE